MGNALQPRQETVDKILNAPRPTNKKELHAFLGLVTFYRRFIPNFATVVSPLTDATRKGAPNRFEFRDAQIQAFAKLKQHIVNPAILRLADLQRTFILQMIYLIPVGAVLLQEDDEALKHPVAFASRKLPPKGDKVLYHPERMSRHYLGNREVSGVFVWQRIYP